MKRTQSQIMRSRKTTKKFKAVKPPTDAEMHALLVASSWERLQQQADVDNARYFELKEDKS